MFRATLPHSIPCSGLLMACVVTIGCAQDSANDPEDSRNSVSEQPSSGAGAPIDAIGDPPVYEVDSDDDSDDEPNEPSPEPGAAGNPAGSSEPNPSPIDNEGGSGNDGQGGAAGADEPGPEPTSGDAGSPRGNGGVGGADPSAGGNAGNADQEPDRGPTPAQDGANFPFPQNRTPGFCTLPSTYDNADVLAAYELWRQDTVTADGAGGHLRIKRTPSDGNLEQGSTVSEGIAYGMLIAVYMNDQELLDELWQYEQQWLDGQGLMHWYINAAGTQVLGSGAASDADEDMAWALIMADRQWGGGGALGDSYLNIARDLLQKMWAHEVVDGKLLKPGDEWGGWDHLNISYFAPSYYRVFAEVSGNDGWNDVVVTSYDTMENALNEANGNAENGLVPAWSTSEGSPNSPGHYQYDSCRTPFRIGLDYCFFAEPRAQSYVEKTTAFFSNIGVPSIVDGYELNGTPRPEFPPGQSAAFIGPAGVGAMHDPSYQGFVDDAYNALKGLDLLTGGAYYDESWTVLALLMMTGNFLDYTQIEPVTAE